MSEKLEKLFSTRAYDRPKTAAMIKFLEKEAPHRVTGLSIEPDGVFIYTDSSAWSDDAGAGTFRADSETQAIKNFYSRVLPSVLKENPMRKKNPANKSLLNRPELQPAINLFSKAVAASREHMELTNKALNEYGDHGPQISGIIRDHFPNDIKDKLRKLAREVTEFSNAAYKQKPPRVRDSTMRQLSKAVANKEGSGFYGPRSNPARKTTRKKNPAKRFTKRHLNILKKEYSKIDKIDPSMPGYNRMIFLLDGMGQGPLKQIADADIKFLSALARNRIVKENPAKKNPEIEANELFLYANNIGPSARGSEAAVYRARKSYIAARKSGQSAARLKQLAERAALHAAVAYNVIHGSGNGWEWQQIFSRDDVRAVGKELQNHWNEEADYIANPRKKTASKKKVGWQIFGINWQGEIRYVLPNKHPIVTLGLVLTRSSATVYKTKAEAERIIKSPGPLRLYAGWRFGVIKTSEPTSVLQRLSGKKA